MDAFKIPAERHGMIESLKEGVLTDLDPLTEEIERTNRIPEELWRRMRQRGYWGLTISRQTLLVEMATDVYAIRCMLAQVAAMFDRGERPELESSLTRLFAVEMSSRVSDKALTVHGGTALTRPHALERLCRDLRLLWFEGGTTIAQKLLAAGGLLMR